ncbi:MAG: DUF4105 domain-containing protein [Flavobacterium sp.]|nr:MAG: DUF4105 domain-containing protein [Flavobacterium sp.]
MRRISLIRLLTQEARQQQLAMSISYLQNSNYFYFTVIKNCLTRAVFLFYRFTFLPLSPFRRN